MKKLVVIIAGACLGFWFKDRIREEIFVLWMRHKMRVFEENTRSDRSYLKPPSDGLEEGASCPSCRVRLSLASTEGGGWVRRPCPDCISGAILRYDMDELFKGRRRIIEEMKSSHVVEDTRPHPQA